MNKSFNTGQRITQWIMKPAELADFEALLNLLPEATLVVDAGHNSILMANSAMLKKCAYTFNELKGMAFDELIPKARETRFEMGSDYPIILNRRKREPELARLKVSAILSEGHLLLTVYEAAAPESITVDRQLDVLSQMYALSRTVIEASDDLLGPSAKLVQDLTGAQVVSIYKAETDQPRLVRLTCAGSPEVFPEILPSTDLMRMPQTILWKPGKRVLSEIHRSAKVNNVGYTISTPLGDVPGLVGLLVVAGQDSKCPDNLQALVPFAGAIVSAILQNQLRASSLEVENTRFKSRLIVREAVFENCQEGIILLTPDLQVAHLNPSAEMMLGYAASEVRNQPVESILIGPEGLGKALQQARQGTEIPNIGQVNINRRDGHSFPAQIKTVPIVHQGDVTDIMVLITDVTSDEQFRVRSQQLEHRAVLGDFTAVFAHEVRNPINNISTGLQLLASRVDPEDPNYDTINRMLTDCGRLDHLMESVLAFSRPLENTFNPLDINAFITRLLDRWHPRLARVNIELYLHKGENLPVIFGDLRSLEQVFTNLISNAVEAMSKNGGMLSVRTQLTYTIPNRPQVEIDITDNGPGIPEEILEHIFEPFVTTKQHKGTGLGLAISKRIIMAHQGSIWASSFPGGTVFHVLLPAQSLGG